MPHYCNKLLVVVVVVVKADESYKYPDAKTKGMEVEQQSANMPRLHVYLLAVTTGNWISPG